MHDRRSRLIAAGLLASFIVVAPLRAQADLSHLGDASLVPKGMLRLHAATAFTRYDSRFGISGAEPLGALFTADSLGVRQIPRLAVAESLVQAVSGVPFALTLGTSRLDATAREEIVPIAMEYGVTRRLAVRVIVPLVRKRGAVQFRLDTAGGFGANVGPNAHRTSAAAAQQNAVVQAQFADAALQLQTRLSSCQSNPAGPGCAALLARQTEAEALIAASQQFAGGLELIFGSTANTGQPFVPRTESAAFAAIQSRIDAFNAQYRDLLTAGADILTSDPFAAAGPAGTADLQRYFTLEGFRDSVVTQERVGVGDVEVGFTLLVLDRPRTETRRTGVQLAVASSLALATGSDDSPSEVIDMRLGTGASRVDSRAILDASAGRFGVLGVGRFQTVLNHAASGDAVAPGFSRPATDASIAEMQVAPRWHVTGPLAFHLAYAWRSGDVTGTDQLIGAGMSFSGLAFTPAGRTPPIEMRFTHLESLSGDAGRPKFFRDQIELRIYYRLRR
jgi:hypothetical protein